MKAQEYDESWDENDALKLFEVKPSLSTGQVAYQLNWDLSRAIDCMQRLKKKGFIKCTAGRWSLRIIQLKLIETESSPLEQNSKSQSEGTPLEQNSRSQSEGTPLEQNSKSQSEGTPLEQNEDKLPVSCRENKTRNKGSGYVRMRECNKKRNQKRGKPPDYYYVWYYSYTDNNGIEQKRSRSLKQAQVSMVKAMIEKKIPYYEILKWLKR